MANWNKPDLQSQYTEVLNELDSRLEDSARLFDGTVSTNTPDGAKRWNGGDKVFEVWNATTSVWVPVPLDVAVEGGGTGAETASGARDALGNIERRDLLLAGNG